MIDSVKCSNCNAAIDAAPPEVPLLTCVYCATQMHNPAAQAQRTAATAPNLPAGIADLLADRDGDGIPDIVQGKGGAQGATVTTTTTTTTSQSSYVINGQRYNSPEEMPPDVRQIFEKTAALLGKK